MTRQSSAAANLSQSQALSSPYQYLSSLLCDGGVVRELNLQPGQEYEFLGTDVMGMAAAVLPLTRTI